jgi:hypothetical protein
MAPWLVRKGARLRRGKVLQAAAVPAILSEICCRDLCAQNKSNQSRLRPLPPSIFCNGAPAAGPPPWAGQRTASGAERRQRWIAVRSVCGSYLKDVAPATVPSIWHCCPGQKQADCRCSARPRRRRRHLPGRPSGAAKRVEFCVCVLGAGCVRAFEAAACGGPMGPSCTVQRGRLH